MTFGHTALVVLRDEGEVVTALGSRYRYKVVGGDTDGAYSLVEEVLLDPEGPPMHVHDHEEEAFYVLAGRARFAAGEERRDLSAGDFILVPRGVPHTLARLGEEELRMLVIVSPPGFEQFFRDVQELEAAAGSPLSEEEVVAFAATYGTRIVGPPLGS
jgi:mannose-6-phosphate isomerase-like protein (cupin superfamily)